MNPNPHEPEPVRARVLLLVAIGLSAVVVLALLLAGCAAVVVVVPPPASPPAPPPACPLLELEDVTVNADGQPTVWLVARNPGAAPVVIDRAALSLHDAAGTVYRAGPEARTILPGGELEIDLTAPEGTLLTEARLDASPCPPAVVLINGGAR